MQLTDIRDRVRNRVGISSTDALATDAIMTTLINDAIDTISLKMDWPWLEASETIATVVGTTSYTPAATWRTTQRLSISDDNLLYKNPTDIAQYSAFTGYPRFFTVELAKIVLAPTPDAVYSVTHVYTKVETDLSADADEPAVYDWAMPLVIVGAAKLLATRLKDPSLLQMIKEEERDIEEGIKDELRRGRPFPKPRHRNDWNL